MWLEVKIIINGIGIIFIAIVLSQILFFSVFLSFILVMAIGLVVFSDIAMGYLITKSRANYLIDRPPGGKTLAMIFTLNNMFDFEWAKKGPHGKREFVYNSKEASCIDKGDYPIHSPS